MTNKKITDFTTGPALTGNEFFPIAIGDKNYKYDLNFISTWFSGKPTAYNFGALADDPTVSPFDGGPIPLGAQYYNTTLNAIRAFGDGGWFTPNLDAAIFALATGAQLVGTPEGTVQDALDGRLKSADAAAAGAAESMLGSAAYSPASGKRLGMLGAAVRYDAGAIGLINDSGHLPVGITSVEAIDDWSFRVHYDHSFTQVGTLLGSLDNDLGPRGVLVFASVGVSYATFTMCAPLIFTAQGDGAILNIDPFWEDEVSLNTAGSTSVIFNKPAGLNTNGPQVTPLTSGVPMLLSTAWGSTTVTVASVAPQSIGGGHVVYTGGVFVLSNSNVTGLSVAASGNTCVITHPSLGTRADRMLVASNSSLRPELLTRTDLTTTVQFRKPDGTVATVASDSADMKFDFGFGGLTPLSTLPATAKFTVDCGLCKVKLAQLGKVALNNLWLTGFMNKD